MTQYDDTNRGALFPPRNKPNSTEPNTRVMLTGKINDNGQRKTGGRSYGHDQRW